MLAPNIPHTNVISSATAVTATENSNTVNRGKYNGFVAFLNCTAVSGTSPTLDVKFQDSYNGTDWQDIPSAAFTQVTAAGTQRIVVSNVASYVRAVATVGGTTPSFTVSVDVDGLGGVLL